MAMFLNGFRKVAFAPRVSEGVSKKGMATEAQNDSHLNCNVHLGSFVLPPENSSLGSTKRHGNFLESLRESPRLALGGGSMASHGSLEKRVCFASVVAVEGREVLLDFGLKNYVRAFRGEFQIPVAVGDEIPVTLLNLETPDGDVLYDYNFHDSLWYSLKQIHENNQWVWGRILNVIPGGFSVGVGGWSTFLPRSHLCSKPELGAPKPFGILSMDGAKRNLVVSQKPVAPVWQRLVRLLRQVQGSRPASSKKAAKASV